MTNEQLNEALAKWAGWEKCTCSPVCKAWHLPGCGDVDVTQPAPDFCNDLNAMATLEVKAPLRYWVILNGYVGADVADTFADSCRLLAGASARQRAEAMARTVGVWKEEV